MHYVGDVLIGWGIGILTVIAFYYLERPARNFLSRYRKENLLIGIAVIAFAMMLITWVLPQPPNDNFGAIGGMTIGFTLGLALEKRYVNFTVEAVNGQKWRLALRVIIGIVLILGMMVGLSGILPTGDMWLRSLRYFLIAVTGTFVWPLIFKRINL